MSYQLPDELDKNKIFLVNLSELGCRFDPKMSLFQRSLKQFKQESQRFSQILSVQPQYGANEAGIDRLSSSEPRYIRITDINEYGLLRDELGKTAKVVSSQYMLNNNDILIARSGATVGKAYIHKVKDTPYPCFFAGYMIRFVVDENKVTPDYVFIYTQLDIYKKWVDAIQRAAGQPNINAEEYKSLTIPLPPKDIQTQIVAKMDAAYAAKKQKEAEAQALLDSIDGYLLAELGIELPEEKLNTIQNRMFTRQLSEVSGGRFDPDYFQEEYEKLHNSLQQGKFESKEIREATDSVINGNTPASTDYSDVETVYPIIKVKSYEGEYISFKKLDFTSAKKLKQARKNDIFILSAAHQASYVGRFIKLLDSEPPINTSFVGELICIRPNEDICNPMYLFSLLNIEVCKVLLNREKTGQTSHIYPTDIKHIKIPLPPLIEQNKFADHIVELRNQAKQLKQEAKEGLEQAKQEVETMILGEL